MSLLERVDPECRGPLEALLARLPGGLGAIRDLTRRRQTMAAIAAELSAGARAPAGVTWEERRAGEVAVRVYRPAGAAGPLAGVLFIHGGGMIMGSAAGSHLGAAALCEALGAAIVSVDYRLAPEHPYPAALEDCYAALVWLAEAAPELGVDRERLAVFGKSAGGGLAVATALLGRDRGGPPLRYMAAIYPMLDDRNQTPSSHLPDLGVWDRAHNLEAWAMYLGGSEPDAYAAPARCADLTGLPPTFMDVGELDLFRDEDLAFAARLVQSGVPVELHVYPGAFHTSEGVAPQAALSERIWATRFAALRRALS